MDRRAFLAAATGMLGGIRLPLQGERQSPRTRLILLGTGGGPRPRKSSSASAQVVLVNDMAYVVDCGFVYFHSSLIAPHMVSASALL